MKQVKKIYNEDVLTLLESLTFEVETRKALIAFLVQEKISNQDWLDKQFKEYQDYYIELEQAKKTFEHEYIKKDYPTAKSWSVDFYTRETIIILPDD